MPAPTNTLLIEGSFEELVEEFTQYLDNLKKAQGEENSAIQDECSKLLQEDKKEEILKKLVVSGAVLNSAPEKEFIAAYNLLIHLIRHSPEPDQYLAKICDYLTKHITSSPNNGTGLALSILSTIFNTVQPNDETRYHVFFSILRVIRSSGNFETLKPRLKNLDAWLVQWEVDEAEQRKLFLAITDVAEEAGESDQAYEYLIKALRTIPAEECSQQYARELSLRALKSALTHPSHFDFQDLTNLDSIQALRTSDPTYFELLEIFNADVLDDFNDFKDEHEGWIEAEGLDGDALNRKMRLLTLASIAASAGQTRVLPYSHISHALQIPSEEVEMWVIDVIRAGLVEGKLSQLNQTFLIHRSTYRVFSENQWKEVASRLAMWRNSLVGVLQVIQNERANFATQKEAETREADSKVNTSSGGGQGGYRKGGQRNTGPITEVELE